MSTIDPKEWTLRLLAGTARSFVRRVKSVSAEQLTGIELAARRDHGISPEVTVSTIHHAIAEVPNPVLDRVEAAKKMFPQ